LWRRASISDWKFPIVALKSFSFVPAMNASYIVIYGFSQLV
jgi:hypothetical protein